MKTTKPNKTALAAAIDILARRSYSRKMLSDKLKLKGYDEAEIGVAIECLTKRGYLNDHELCEWLYRQYIEAEHYSRRQIEAKLLQKGFEQSVISDCRQSGDSEREICAAAKVLRIRYNTRKMVDSAKMLQYLYTKGFARDVIRMVVADFTKQRPAEELIELD